MFKIKKKSNYQSRIIKMMLVISVVPIIFLGTLAYYNTTRIVQDKVNEANYQSLLQTQMRFEQTLDVVYNYYVLLGNESTIIENLERKLTYQDVLPVNDIQNRLVELQNLQTIVKSAHLVNVEQDWIIHSGGFSESIAKDNKDYMNGFMNDPRNIIWSVGNKVLRDQSSLISQDTTLNGINLFIKVPYNVPNYQGAIVVNLSELELSRYFESDADQQNMIVIDERGIVVYHQDKSLVGSQIQESISGFDPFNLQDDSRFLESQMGDEAIGILYKKSDYNDWTYMSYYSIDDITREARTIGLITLIVCLVTIAIIFALAVYGSKLLYNPVEFIYKSIKSVSDDKGKSTNDEMKYINRGIISLVENQNRLKGLVEKQIAQIEELFILKLLRRELSHQQIHQKKATIDKLETATNYSIINIQAEVVENAEDRTKDEDIILLLILNTIIENIDQNVFLQPVIYKGVVVMLITGKQDNTVDFKEHVFATAEKLQNIIQTNLDIGITIGISNTYQKLEEVHIGFKEGVEALLCKRDLKETILFYEDVAPGKVIRVAYPKSLEAELIQAINRGNEKEIIRLVDLIVETIFSTRTGYNEHKLYINRLLIAILNVLQASGATLSRIVNRTDSIMEEISNISTAKEMKVWFKVRLIKPMLPVLIEQRNNKNTILIEEVKRMIEEEYDRDLSLEECASRLNYHPSYIWKVMKHELDMSFTDYLLAHRLKVAKQLLVDSDMTIGKIAEHLRYTNAQNFIRYFKKLEGVTPGQYRKDSESQS